MPLPVLPGVTRVTILGHTPSGTKAANILHAKFTGAGSPTPTDLANLAADCGHLYTTAYGGGQSWAATAHTSAGIDQIITTPLDGLSASTPALFSTVGLISSADALPADTALVFTLRTAKRGRQYRGRQYWWGFTEQLNQSNGQASSTTVNLMLTQWAGFMGGTGLGAHTWQLVVASYKHLTAETVTAVTADLLFDRQKRRKTPV